MFGTIRKRTTWWVTILCWLGGLTLAYFIGPPRFLRAQDGTIVGISQVPAKVRDAADSIANNTQWLVAFRFDVDPIRFRLVGRDDKVHLICVTAFADGEITDIRTQISFSELPRAVRDGLKAKFPDFKPKKIEALGKTSVAQVYRLEGTQGGIAKTIVASPDGTAIGEIKK